MTSRAERKRQAKRRRAAAVSLAGEAPAQQPARYPNGKIKPEDARKTALQARIRVFGGDDTPEGQKAASDPLWGCSVGRLILCEPEHLRGNLWDAAQHARKTQAAYDRAIGAPSRHAQCLRILAPVDAMQADAASPAPDDRSVEERVRDATRAQMQVEGWISYADGRAVSAFKRHVIDDIDGPIRDWEGVKNCLMCISEGLSGNKLTVRIRRV